MLRRGLALASLLLLVLPLSGCRHLGPGNDHGAKVSTVVYAVTGSGVSTVSYAATGTSTLTSRSDVELPFSITVHTRDHSQTEYAVAASASQGALSCSITVNGVRVSSVPGVAGKPVECTFVK